MVRWIGKLNKYLLAVFFASLIFSNTLAQGVAIISIILWIFSWIVSRRLVPHPLDLAVIIYLVVRTITCFTSVSPGASFHELRSGVFFSLVYFAITQHVESKEKERVILQFLAILIYAGAIAALYGVGYVVVHQFGVRAQSTAGGITRFSEYTMIAFCLSITLLGERRIFPKKVLGYGVMGALMLGLIFAQARAQWIAIVPVVIVVGAKRERWMLVFAGGLIGFMIVTVREIRERIKTLIHPTKAMSERFLIWKGARDVFFQRPLRGFGPRTYRSVSPYLKDKGTWHSDYLQTYLDSGVFGFLSYLYLSVMLFRGAIRIVRTPEPNALGWALLLTLIAMYITSMVGGHIQEPVITPLFFSFVAFVSVLSKET